MRRCSSSKAASDESWVDRDGEDRTGKERVGDDGVAKAELLVYEVGLRRLTKRSLACQHVMAVLAFAMARVVVRARLTT
jgi:hypothetical protein